MVNWIKKINMIILMLLIIFITIIGINIIKNIKISKPVEEQDIQGEITFLSNRTDKREEIQQLIEEFQFKYSKVKIKLELIGNAEAILGRKASIGELADITLVPESINNKDFNKYFLSIDNLGFDTENIYNYESGLGSDGRLYALSSSINWEGIIYNTEVFKKANINCVPKTFEEFFYACERIKELGIIPIAINYGQSWTMNSLINIIPRLFDRDIEKTIIMEKQELFSINSGIYKSLNLAREIVNRGYCEEDLLNYDWQQFKNDMSSGKVAMAILPYDFIKQFEDMGMKQGVLNMFPIPGTNNIRICGDYKFAISKNSKNPEIAKLFFKFIFENDRYANSVGITSPWIDSKSSTVFFENLNKYDMPILLDLDYNRNYDSNMNKIFNKYNYCKNKVGLDSSYSQKFIVESDINILMKETQQKWEEALEEYK